MEEKKEKRVIESTAPDLTNVNDERDAVDVPGLFPEIVQRPEDVENDKVDAKSER